jgi:hypothetical protein
MLCDVISALAEFMVRLLDSRVPIVLIFSALLRLLLGLKPG